MAKILVIDDEPTLLESIGEALESEGHDVTMAPSLREAKKHAASSDFDMVLTDVILGTDNGIDFLKWYRSEGFDGVIVVMTAYGTVESAVEAMKMGADDYLQKPLSLDELDIQVKRWLERRTIARRLELYERLDRANAQSANILGESDAWREALKLAERFAEITAPSTESNADAGLPTILLLGETGCGKGMMARHIHDSVPASGDGKASTPPFVHVNCAALPSTLIESELFGHEKGAYTDAREARAGLFEMADGGTIFLDEIGEMPLELQAKILLVVEQGTFRRVGGSRERRVQARIIAATHQATDRLVEDERLRRDLFYRLSKFTVRIPPLRERADDRLLIANAVLDSASSQYKRGKMTFSPSARQAIERHPWPGNVRELVNSVQRAAALCEGSQIKASDLGIVDGQPGVEQARGELDFDFVNNTYTVDDVERTLLVQALKFTKGNVSKAARLIGMQRSSMRYKIEKLSIIDDVPEVSRR